MCRYFFAEVFDFFRIFFLIVFHVNILFMILPLAIRLNHRPVFLAFVYVAISSMLKSYPSVSCPFIFCLKSLFLHRFTIYNSSLVNCKFNLLPLQFDFFIHTLKKFSICNFTWIKFNMIMILFEKKKHRASNIAGFIYLWHYHNSVFWLEHYNNSYILDF